MFTGMDASISRSLRVACVWEGTPMSLWLSLKPNASIRSLRDAPAVAWSLLLRGKGEADMATILTVDDDREIRCVLKRGLSSLGHKVIQAENGRKALRAAFWRKIDVVLLDISMPGMDGLTVLRRLKASSRTQHIPVIMLSGLDEPGLKDQASYDYAEHYIMKTVSMRTINDTVLMVLNRVSQLPGRQPVPLSW
jgi:two-component system chemotaxis response regulator CheY